MSRFDPYQHLSIRLNPDGTLTRLSNIPNTEANPGVIPGLATVSKDVTVNAETKVWARIFCHTQLPSNDNTVARLPILFYFHDGGFVFYSAANLAAHQACSALASEIPVIVVAVDHRLAPEHRLPAQYEDAVDTILWVKKQALDSEGEKWLRDYGDFTRCYLGGNIALHAALRALNNNDIKPLNINALPKGTGRDHRFCNPLVDGPYKSKVSSIRRCLVIAFNMDPMFDRVQAFVEMLVKQGVQVEARFDEVGFHNIDLVDIQRSQALLNILKEFII
ncbi:hypothetical protein CRYUN_Cryun14cG0025600 [Craigia yunnanensis]